MNKISLFLALIPSSAHPELVEGSERLILQQVQDERGKIPVSSRSL